MNSNDSKNPNRGWSEYAASADGLREYLADADRELSTLRASLAERDEQLRDAQIRHGEEAVLHEKAKWEIRDRAEALVAERDRQLVVLREALTECKRVIDGGTWSLAQTGIGIDDAVNATRKADAALASTSSAAERVERRIGAKVLREAEREMADKPPIGNHSDSWWDGFRAALAMLRDKATA